MKSKKILTMLLISTMTLSNVLPVFASPTIGEVVETENLEGNLTEAQENQAHVEYVAAESFSVVIPKKITLDGTTARPSQDFTVKVSGDIEGTSTIKVYSDENFYLKQDGKADVKVNLGNSIISANPETRFERTYTSSEIAAENGSTKSGYLAVSYEDDNKLTAGSWEGDFKFYINYEKKN